MLSNREQPKIVHIKDESTSALITRKIASKTVIKHNKSTDIDYSAKISKMKQHKKSKMIKYQEKMNSKIRDEYNIKKKDKEN